LFSVCCSLIFRTLRMAIAGTLYGDPNGFRAKKIATAAEFANKKIKLETLDKMDRNWAFPPSELLFVTNEGNQLFDCNSIACYLANPFHGSGGGDQFHDSEVLQWINMADSKILAPILSWVIPCLSAESYNNVVITIYIFSTLIAFLRSAEWKAAQRYVLSMVYILFSYYNLFLIPWYVSEAKAESLDAMRWLNEQLLSKTFLVGERISVVDIILACNVLPAYQHVVSNSLFKEKHMIVFDERVRKLYANVTRWFLTIINQPFFKKAIGNVPLCDKPAVFDSKKYEEFVKKSLTVERIAPKDNKDGAKVQSKAKAKQAEAPKKEVEVDVEEKVAESDKKDPFAAFPKGKFDMDGFKRVYSNEDTETKAIPYFWSHFDPDNYSIWFCEYKYPKELEKVFMSCNLITGMFQRLDKLRKNAFASVCLFGEDNNSTISGIWIWRGHQLAFELSEDWQIDYESYSWSKLDPKDEKIKSLVNEYLKWEGKFDGKKFNQGKIFK
ncbi:Elongation factor 1-gamma, partial [Trichinella sp. T6]